MRPRSSAPQNAKRTRARVWAGSRASRSAASSTAAEPLPLSLMPGPSGTLSRCAPTTIRGPLPLGAGLGQHVSGRTLAGDRVDREAHGGAAVGPRCHVQGAPAFVGDADDRNGGGLVHQARKDVGPAVRALVHDHDTDGAGRDRVLDLGLERAGPATDQRHGAALETCEVGGFAAAGRRGRRPAAELEIHRAQPPRHIARAGVGQGANGAGGLPVRLAHGQDRRRAVLEVGELEFLEADHVACLLQPLRDILRGPVVAGRAGGAVAAIRDRDVLQGPQVTEGALACPGVEPNRGNGAATSSAPATWPSGTAATSTAAIREACPRSL